MKIMIAGLHGTIAAGLLASLAACSPMVRIAPSPKPKRAEIQLNREARRALKKVRG